MLKTLICGLGSKLQGDDGLGPYVIEELEKECQPEGVTLADYGISGFKCALNLAHYDRVIFVDAVSLPGRVPGTLHHLRIPREKLSGRPTLGDAGISMHETDLPRILATAAALGTAPREIIVIGCQPADTRVRLGLSPDVEKAVPAIIEMVKAELSGS
jgi:hydrogenase maturation protease